ncbi:hypothetical protein QFZ87_000911 [Bacillus sp. SLBN-46]|uniref:hypothetical protein n=1 Tax=Bacillus sp. SLBN-46 TaxID=3042283 RepID=UPI0028663472|nr:hypothetical protein [Bacillus sp. SLBN-46]MDR6121314.1 hypothetical protein [Bacillus sp. SLBN-46]
MIKDKKYLYIALIPFLLSMALNFPFPDAAPYGETLVSVFDIPIRTESGINFIGILSLLLLILCLYLLSKSLNKYKVRLVLLAILIAVFVPTYVVKSFQKTVATGIYAVSYESEESTCSFEKNNETTLNAICELPFKNYSDKSVEFTVVFKNLDYFPLGSIMNSQAPYKVGLKGNERRVVKIETSVDVSRLEIQMDSGEVAGFNFIIKSGGKSRKL